MTGSFSKQKSGEHRPPERPSLVVIFEAFFIYFFVSAAFTHYGWGTEEIFEALVSKSLWFTVFWMGGMIALYWRSTRTLSRKRTKNGAPNASVDSHSKSSKLSDMAGQFCGFFFFMAAFSHYGVIEGASFESMVFASALLTLWNLIRAFLIRRTSEKSGHQRLV